MTDQLVFSQIGIRIQELLKGHNVILWKKNYNFSKGIIHASMRNVPEGGDKMRRAKGSDLESSYSLLNLVWIVL